LSTCVSGIMLTGGVKPHRAIVTLMRTIFLCGRLVQRRVNVERLLECVRAYNR